MTFIYLTIQVYSTVSNLVVSFDLELCKRFEFFLIKLYTLF